MNKTVRYLFSECKPNAYLNNDPTRPAGYSDILEAAAAVPLFATRTRKLWKITITQGKSSMRWTICTDTPVDNPSFGVTSTPYNDCTYSHGTVYTGSVYPTWREAASKLHRYPQRAQILPIKKTEVNTPDTITITEVK